MNNVMNFSDALNLIKVGLKMTRLKWNAKNQFVYFVPGSTFSVNIPPLLGIYPPETVITYRPHIDLRAADGTVGTWSPSNSDVLADDWCVHE